MPPGFIQRLRVDEERQCRVVRDAAIVLETLLSYLIVHRVLPSFGSRRHHSHVDRRRR
jgi:hypothetical protein